MLRESAVHDGRELSWLQGREGAKMAQSEWANLYQLYERNGNRCGFRVLRNSWGNTSAIVRSIGGQTEGPLPGKSPYYGNPDVIADVSGTWTEQGAKLSSPGTYAWKFA